MSSFGVASAISLAIEILISSAVPGGALVSLAAKALGLDVAGAIAVLFL